MSVVELLMSVVEVVHECGGVSSRVWSGLIHECDKICL